MMRAVPVRLVLALISLLALHELGMTIGAHTLASGELAPPCGEPVQLEVHATHHAGRHHSPSSDDQAYTPVDMTHTCWDLHAVAPLSRVAGIAIDDSPTAVMPLLDAARADPYAVTSRTLVHRPPAHPPDIDRSLYGVYRI